ncbi:hypothetical protein niasHT_006186 [Heterodera trifolii]|uniref:Cytochrome P450 n=1 Tax=Heterodera trifolii TaxID=157864 RepID=A0ABD2M2D7_9BILA
MFWLILLQISFLFFCLFLAFYFFWLYRAAYWKRRGIPCPDGKLFSGNLDEMFWEEKLRFFQLAKWTEQYGKVYGLVLGWERLLVISEPAMVQEMLTTKFDCFHERMMSALAGDVDKEPRMHLFNARGARWKRLRATANPAFSVSNLKKLMPTMDDSVKVAIELMEKERKAQPNVPINLHRYFVEMTFDVIARVAMGQRESRQFHSEDAKLAVAAFLRFQNNWFEYLATLFPWLGTKVIKPFIRQTGKIRHDPFALMDNKIREAVKERHQMRQQHQQKQQQQNDSKNNHFESDQKRPIDFIDLFLDAVTDEENIEYKNQFCAFNKAVTKINRINTVDEIGMQLLLFLLAGYYLACHPDVQLKAQEEIDTVCLSENPTYEELSQLKYMEAVIKETLRLTTTLGQILVEKGTGVTIDLYTFHRNKELWGDDADEFRPERWLDIYPSPASAHYYAFGGGPRICIGMRFALLEEKMALVRLLRRYSLAKTEQTEKLLKVNSQVVLNPGAVMVQLNLREGNS